MLDKILLLPYRLVLKYRHSLYNRGLKKQFKAEVPTICVGNVTVGGTGKTPHVEMILRMLMRSARWGESNLAVLSRGYKRSGKGFQQVTREGGASLFGDEPLQIKKRFPSVTVAVDRDRVEGAGFLARPESLAASSSAAGCWNRNFPAADIIVLDDAFQYRRLKADIDIVLIDYNRPISKDRLLPFGSLRDLPERADAADVIIVSKCPADLDNWDKTAFAYSMGYSEFRTSDCEGTNRSGHRQKLFFTTIRYENPQKVYSTSDSRYFYSKKLILFSGIAKDTPLVRYFSGRCNVVNHFTFPDHHKYSRADIGRLLRAVSRHPTASVATTEKDAQRILDYVGMPQKLMQRMFYIPISACFLSEEEERAFGDILDNLGKSSPVE